eukprot:m.155336 g.155336  ORF g.155336 m.155336 type:complete len:85 (-) comp20807_c1_seq7:6777-7031(-)
MCFTASFMFSSFFFFCFSRLREREREKRKKKTAAAQPVLHTTDLSKKKQQSFFSPPIEPPGEKERGEGFLVAVLLFFSLLLFSF